MIQRALADVQELKARLGSEFTGRLSYDFADGSAIRLDGITFPTGWTNRCGGRHGRILFELPESYPEHPPHVYISDDMRYDGSRPATMSPGRIEGDADWAAFSLFQSADDWDPANDTLVTAFDRLFRTLQDPEPTDAIEE